MSTRRIAPLKPFHVSDRKPLTESELARLQDAADKRKILLPSELNYKVKRTPEQGKPSKNTKVKPLKMN